MLSVDLFLSIEVDTESWVREEEVVVLGLLPFGFFGVSCSISPSTMRIENWADSLNWFVTFTGIEIFSYKLATLVMTDCVMK